MKVLVTGGAGFIGSHLTERLAREGHEVKVYDNLSTGKRSNLEGAGVGVTTRSVELVEADVRDLPQLEWHLAGCEVVFHQAAIVSVPRSVADPQESHDVNLQGTLNVLQAARRQKVRRVVFASSAAIYGDEPTLPKHEGMLPAPASPYGIEKLTSEHYLDVWNRLHGLETVALRYFNVFGPRQDPSSPYSGVISIFVDRALRGEGVTFFGDGGHTRDFVFVEDVVQANVLAGTTRGVSGVFNVARGEETSLRGLVSKLESAVGRSIPTKQEAPRAGDIRASVANIDKAKGTLGYAPRVTVEEGLRRLVTHLGMR